MTTTTFHGPWLQAPNLSADSVGSIHDESQAKRLGFKAALIGGSVLSAFLTPAMVELFGPAWYEKGFLKQTYVKPIYDNTPFRVSTEDLPKTEHDERLVSLSFEMEDGEAATVGYAGLARSAETALAPWEREGEPPPATPGDRDPLPDEPLGLVHHAKPLTISPGLKMNAERRSATGDESPWYTDASPWGGAIVPTFMYILLGGASRDESEPRQTHPIIRAGMNATFQLLQTGPMFCDKSYGISSSLIDKGYSRRTAFRTTEYTIGRDDGTRVAAVRQKIRWFAQ